MWEVLPPIRPSAPSWRGCGSSACQNPQLRLSPFGMVQNPVWDVPERAGAVFCMVPTRGWDISAGLGGPPSVWLRQGTRNLSHPQPSRTFESSLATCDPAQKPKRGQMEFSGPQFPHLCHDSPCPQTGPAHPPQSPTHGQGCGQLCRGRRCPDPLPTNCGGHDAGDKDSEPQGGLPDAASMRGAAGAIVSDTFLSKEVAETRDAPQVSLGLHSMPGVAPSCRGPEQSGHLPRDVQRHQGEDGRP